MAYDFRGPAGEFRLNRFDWPEMMKLAKQYGWVPHGTLPPQIMKLRSDLPQYYRDAHHAWEADLLKAYEEGRDPSTLPPDPLPDDAWIETPRDDAWLGEYDSNDYQRVTDEDAANLAAALEQALPELRDYNVTDIKPRPTNDWLSQVIADAAREAGIDDAPQVMRFGPADDSDPIEYFSGDNKQTVIAFIAFCKAGGFVIG